MDLSDRKAAGEQVDSRNIRKHKNDVFRLTELLDWNQNLLPGLSDKIEGDMREFIERMRSENVDLKQLGIQDKSKKTILEELRTIYRVVRQDGKTES